MQCILIGPIFHLVPIVGEVPTQEFQINIKSVSMEGRFKLVPGGERGLDNLIYPYFTYERIGDIPEGQHGIRAEVLG